MKHDLSKLFTGGRNKPAFEVVLAKKGPFTGRRVKLATNEARSAYEFMERNKQSKAAAPVPA